MNNVFPKLPPGWAMVRIGDLCEKNTGTCDPRENPEVPFLYVDISGVDNIQKKITEPKKILGKDAPSRARQLIQRGDVIVSTTRPNLNAVAIVPKELDGQICSTGFCVLRVKDGLESEYLFAYVRSQGFVSNLSELVKGALYPAVTDGQVRSQFIPLPPTIEEQQRIIAWINEKLEAVERARSAAEEQNRFICKVHGATLREIFENPLAKRWATKPLGEISRLSSGSTPSRGNKLSFVGNIPWVKTLDLNLSYVTKTEECISREAYEEIRGEMLPVGTVMVAMYGGVGTIGKSGMLGINATTNQAICSILPNPDIFVSEFVHFWLMYIRPAWMKYSSGNRKDPNINKGIVAAMKCPLPSLEEQRHIVDALQAKMTTIDSLKSSAQAQAALIGGLPTALFQRAFNGEI